jgi:hypothetical protein
MRPADHAPTALAANHRHRHVPAFVAARMALQGALLAVFVVMALTFGGADVANLRAHSADFRREMRLAIHKRGSRAAELRAIHVEPNTFLQLGRIRFVTTCFRAMVALFGAL